mgnify:CR=1 FL=1
MEVVLIVEQFQPIELMLSLASHEHSPTLPKRKAVATGRSAEDAGSCVIDLLYLKPSFLADVERSLTFWLWLPSCLTAATCESLDVCSVMRVTFCSAHRHGPHTLLLLLVVTNFAGVDLVPLRLRAVDVRDIPKVGKRKKVQLNCRHDGQRWPKLEVSRRPSRVAPRRRFEGRDRPWLDTV